MAVKPVWTWLSLAATVLMVVTSAAGICLPSTYARETRSWATQGCGQDLANLLVVVPAMLIALHFEFRSSVRATLIALGLRIYIVYSYVLYAFFIHFGPWFPAYVAILGLSAFALSGAVLHMDRDELARVLGNNRSAAPSGVLLIALALLFGARWLSEIVPAIRAGVPPQDVVEIGAFVNPVHVLDLAFILPGMIVTAVALWRRRPLGLLFAAPLLTFATVMGIAILAMFFAARAWGAAIPTAPVLVISAVVLFSLWGACSFLRRIGSPQAGHLSTVR
jgi:hypothetical protein